MYLRDPEIKAKYKANRKARVEGYCPLCDKRNLGHRILEAHEHWLVVKNDYPYARQIDEEWLRAQTQVMMVSRRHVAGLGDLSPEAVKEWNDILFSWVERLGDAEIYHKAGNSTDLTVTGHTHSHIILW